MNAQRYATLRFWTALVEKYSGGHITRRRWHTFGESIRKYDLPMNLTICRRENGGCKMKIRKFGVIIPKITLVPALFLVGICSWWIQLLLTGEIDIKDPFLCLGWLFMLFCGTFIVWLYWHYAFVHLHKVDGGHITDTIFIDARGIRQESKKGENKFVPWEEVESIRRLTCHRSPPIISVTAADGSRLWWYASSRKALKYIQSQHPEIPITEPTTREDWGEGEEEQT